MHCRILTVSGSLRAASSNGAILHAARLVAPADVEMVHYDGLASLPHFNPDLDRALDDPLLPAPVRALRAMVASMDAVVISSPEYAHGVPGSLKNVLDWLVGGSEIVDKPVALWNTAPHATHAQASLAETLRTMSAHLVAEAGISVTVRGLSAAEITADRDVAERLGNALQVLAEAGP